MRQRWWPAGWLIAATADDADAFRSELAEAGTAAAIPSHPSRAHPIAHDRPFARRFYELSAQLAGCTPLPDT